MMLKVGSIIRVRKQIYDCWHLKTLDGIVSDLNIKED